MRSWLVWARSGAAVAALMLPSAAWAQEIDTIPTRPGVTVRVLLVKPAETPSATVLFFPGGWGAGHFREEAGRVALGSNFLVRSAPLFAERGLLAAFLDTPSDQPGGMSDEWRMSAKHVEDVRGVLNALHPRESAAVVLAGTSRGTLSAAYVAATLGDPRVTGLVLTSSMVAHGQGRWATVYEAPLGKITIPVLIVHHRSDNCRATPIGSALALPKWLKRSPRVDFVEVLGGDAAISDPCEPLAPHGFLGRERETVGVIADWIAGRPVPKQVP